METFKLLTNEQLSVYLSQNNNIVEQIEVVIKYIFDLKQVDLSKEQINLPQDQLQQILLHQMYNTALQYYQTHGK